MKSRSIFQMIAIAFAFCLVFLAAPTKAAAQSSCAQWFTAFYPGNAYEFDMDEWNSTATDCITMNDGPGFTVTATNFDLSGGAPAPSAIALGEKRNADPAAIAVANLPKPLRVNRIIVTILDENRRLLYIKECTFGYKTNVLLGI